MFDLDRWKEIWETISRNKKRSIMTALGVFWGIFLFVVLLGVGLGFGRLAMSSLGDVSTNSSFFFADQTSIPYQGMPSGRRWSFDMNDISAIKKQVPGIKYVAGMNWGGMFNFSHKERKGEYYLMGYTPEYQRINPQNILYGRFVNDIDMQEKRKVCLIGTQIWKELFPGGENPVGEVIKMNNMYLTVIGVTEVKGSSFNIGSNPETTVSVPNSLVQQLWNDGISVDMVSIVAHDDADIKTVEAASKRVIAANHIISPDDKKAIGGFSLGEQFEQVGGLFSGIDLLTWIVGMGTLLAGIVGISNIMLVVVRERTQEIGVRRAIGAKPWSIISQILAESFILTFIAGILGMAAGVGILSLVDMIVEAGGAMGGPMAGISWQISFGLGMASIGIIVLGGIIAGLLPASRALRIKAVDAIREE